MLNAIIRSSLRHRGIVVIAMLVVLVYGSYAASKLPIDVFSRSRSAARRVMTEAPGLAPEEVETLVTFPLEGALLGASRVQAVRSQSTAGLSIVYVEFDWGTDIHVARQIVQEKLSTTQDSLPQRAAAADGPHQLRHGPDHERRPGPTHRPLRRRTRADRANWPRRRTHARCRRGHGGAQGLERQQEPHPARVGGWPATARRCPCHLERSHERPRVERRARLAQSAG